jgi:DNA-directed RNA polymerase subunit RPC12/RpoP
LISHISSVKISYEEASFGFGIIYKYVAYPIKTCVICGEEFELKPGKPGFANRCPDCSEQESGDSTKSSDVLKTDKQANAARREAMRNLLYRKDS